MDAPSKQSYPKLLSRLNANRRSLCRSNASSIEASAVTLTSEERGKLGLTTVYEPSGSASVTAEVVFIHGLGGNSRNTWSFTKDPEHFWPGKWLPSDPTFANTRIHIFGYNAEWRDRQQSSLRIHDFAQSLVGELKNDPVIRKDASHIIFVGHSMGGCVAKKAYILARLDPSCKQLVERIHSMFFLGTPHRGAELAPLLENILTIAWGRKPFLQDLLSNTDALAETNDAFRHYAPDLRLWSFYETQPVKTQLLSRIVVEKSSATLGYPNEEIAAMNADHRHLCKFDSREDPNYRLLRNALHTAIDLIGDSSKKPIAEPSIAITQPDSTNETSSLEDFVHLVKSLGINDTVEDDWTILDLLKEPASCSWLTRGDAFSSWASGNGPEIMWLLGRPGVGKSVLSSHVIECLSQSDTHCSYFFFKYGKQGKSTLSDCLLSLAYQMALKDKSTRRDVSRLLEDPTWDRSDETIVWRRLFSSVIFKSPSISKHSWVIDGVDECSNFNSLFTKKFLATIPATLRIFATSRDLEEIGRGLTSLGTKVCRQTISEDDTLDDMRLFLSTRLKELDRLETDKEREEMCNKILDKSRGSFLWVRLVLQDFENAWTDEAMEAALRDVPSDLSAVYHRILTTIEIDPRKWKLAKSILRWIVTASRPLSIDELRCAIKLDINETMQSLVKAIPSICGQFVFVDHAGNVQVIHETTRVFLLSTDTDSEFGLSMSRAHNRLCSLLLGYLSSGVLKPQAKAPQERPKGFSTSRTVATTSTLDLALIAYACQFFSEHIYRSTSQDDALAEELCSFLKSHNVLYWIEYSAQNKDLGNITRAAKNIRGYLKERTMYDSATDSRISLIDSWSIDLIRVAAKFRSQLLVCPSSIHCLIPPVCPTGSIISKTFSRGPKLPSLAVKGIPDGDWDDCLTRIDFDQGESTALAHGARVFAVGLATRSIKVYDTQSFQCTQELEHPERLRLLKFSGDDELLVSCGIEHAVVWNVQSGVSILSFSCNSWPLAVVFLGKEELLLASESSQLMKWDLGTGEAETISWLFDEESDYASKPGPSQQPVRVAFSSFSAEENLLMAVGYRGNPVSIWSPLDLQHLGECGSKNGNGVLAMAFNPNPEINTLVVSYAFGDLCLYNYTNMSLDLKRPRMHATSIDISRDGRTLVTGSGHGVIQVFELDRGETGNLVLTPVYHVKASVSGIRGVGFNIDGLRFVAIGRRQCQMWEPAALFVKDNELECNKEATTLAKGAAYTSATQAKPQITSPLAVLQAESVLLGGKSDATISAFSAYDGRDLGVVYSHNKGASVVRLAVVEKKGLIISADNAGRILVTRLTPPRAVVSGDAAKGPPVVEIILDCRFEATVTQLLPDKEANRLLISGHKINELRDLASGEVLGAYPGNDSPSDPKDHSIVTATATSKSCSAFQHPTDSELFIIVEGDTARVFQWDDFAEITPRDGIFLKQPHHFPSDSRQSVPSYHVGADMVVEHNSRSLWHPGSLILWPATAFDPNSGLAGLSAKSVEVEAFEAAIMTIIEITDDSRLLFVDHDLWVCSSELRASSSSHTATPLGNASQGSRGPGHWPRPAISSFGQSASNSARTAGPINDVAKPGRTRRHFFALSEWRDGTNKLNCAMLLPRTTMEKRRGSHDFAFVCGHRVIIVESGTEFCETITMKSCGTRSGPRQEKEASHDKSIPSTRSRPADVQWTVVSGSMHRRAPAW